MAENTRAAKDFLFNTKSQDFYKAQANILTEDIVNNRFMPEDPRISKNKGLNTTKKNVIAAINETFDMAYLAHEKTMGNAFVQRVNNIAPDFDGNVRITSVDRAIGDSQGRRIDDTYITKDDIPTVTRGTIKTLNGRSPDDSGALNLPIVFTVNNVAPDAHGNVAVDIHNFVLRDEMMEKINAAIANMPIDAIALSNDKAFTDKYVAVENYKRLLKKVSSLEEGIAPGTAKETLSREVEIPANDTLNVQIFDACNANVKTFILDREEGSRTEGKYINADGYITVGYDEDAITIYNDADVSVKVKLIYQE
jgi:hypothetical protein